MSPDVLIPINDPMSDVNFPTMPTKDSSFAVNTMAVIQQYVERVQMAGDTSYGRIAQGKASALRTAGTTMALMSAGDERAEMILRRLFGMFGSAMQIMHRLNKRFLPKEKEIRVHGMSEAGEDAYQTMQRDDIDAEVDFEFLSSMINANKQMLAQELQEIMMVMLTPLAIQMGFVTPEKAYNMLRDFIVAKNQDPDKYMQRPPNPVPGPKRTAEDVVSAVIAGDIPVLGSPAEPLQEHLMKLQTYMDSGGTVQGQPIGVSVLNMMSFEQKQAIMAWANMVVILLQQEMAMQQMLAQAAGQGDGGGEKEGPGGTPTTISSEGTGLASNPTVGKGEYVDESMNPGGLAQ